MESGIKSKKILSFTDLEAWQEGHKLVLFLYKESKSFPKEELFGIVMQMRRCVVSVTSNIAEGFSRYSYREKVQFYTIALGSLTELENQLLIARDVGYLNITTFQQLAQQSIKVQKILWGLIKHTKSIIPNSKFLIHDSY